DGSIYLAGLTNSSDFLTTPGAARVDIPGESSDFPTVFVRRLTSDGLQILYSATVGLSDLSSPVAMGVDIAGNVFVAYRPLLAETMTTRSLEANGDFTIVKISPEGNRFLYRIAVLPNSPRNRPIGFAVESDGAVLIALGESSFDVRKIDPDGARVLGKMKVAC